MRGRRLRPGRYRGEVLRVPGHGGYVMTGGDGLLEELPADAARRREDGQFHWMFPCRVGCAPEGAFTTMTYATKEV